MQLNNKNWTAMVLSCSLGRVGKRVKMVSSLFHLNRTVFKEEALSRNLPRILFWSVCSGHVSAAHQVKRSRLECRLLACHEQQPQSEIPEPQGWGRNIGALGWGGRVVRVWREADGDVL